MPLIKRWNNFFFRAKDPRDLAICRILFCAGIFIHLSLNHYWQWANVHHVFYRRIWLYRAFGLSILSEGGLKAMQFAAMALFFLAMLGLLTRISLGVATLLILYLFALPSSFGKTGHGDAILVLITFILAVSRCDEAFSLERYVRRQLNPSLAPCGRPSGEFRWPIRTAQILLALVFFGAGVTKLRRSGLDWITTDNFANLITQHLQPGHRPITHWGLAIARHPALYKPLAAATILGELLFPLALFSRLAKRFIIPLAFLTQILIGLIIGVWFVQFILCYLFFVPWMKLIDRARGLRPPRAMESPSTSSVEML